LANIAAGSVGKRGAQSNVNSCEEDDMSKLTVAFTMLLGGLSLSGCIATQDYVDKHVAVVQGQVTDQGTKLSQVDQTAQDALNRANAAGKLAEGKFLYSVVLSDDSMKFPIDGSKLSPEAQTRLSDFVQKLKSDNKNVYLEIQGHTDSTGTPDLNMRLGEQRAEAVRLFMNQQGVPLNRMATISYGQTAPVAPNNTREGRAENRRVVVEVLA
jgi:outer membrane protein OmpA-like peptidoglycan-associated protein